MTEPVFPFILKINPPSFEIASKESVEKTFDLIRIFVSIRSGTKKEQVESFKKNRKDLLNQVFTFLEQNKTFQSFQVPVSDLEIGKLTLTSCSQIEVILVNKQSAIDIKDIQR